MGLPFKFLTLGGAKFNNFYNNVFYSIFCDLLLVTPSIYIFRCLFKVYFLISISLKLKPSGIVFLRKLVLIGLG